LFPKSLLKAPRHVKSLKAGISPYKLRDGAGPFLISTARPARFARVGRRKIETSQRYRGLGQTGLPQGSRGIAAFE
jgi:hypothetical protein